MARFLKNRSMVQGKSPGELTFVGKQKVEHPSIRMIQYNQYTLQEQEFSSLREAKEACDEECVTWIDIVGLHETNVIASAEQLFGLHPLTLEDIVNTGQRPKVEEFDSYISVMIKMMRWEPTDGKIHSEQLAIVWGSRVLLTFQERAGDVFDSVRERIRTGKGRVRRSGPDYLAYTLIDSIMDNYLLLIERLGEEIEALEPIFSDEPSPVTLQKINQNQRELHFLRASIRPARDALRELGRLETDLITTSTYIFLRDLNDLGTQAVETMDTYREMLKDQLDSHTASTGNRLNEIMKFLTVFSAVFIPLSLLSGIYGTNFEVMPELAYRYAYLFFWIALVVIASSMIILFKRKRWL